MLKENKIKEEKASRFTVLRGENYGGKERQVCRLYARLIRRTGVE